MTSFSFEHQPDTLRPTPAQTAVMSMYVFFPKVLTMSPKNNVLAVELYDDPAAPATVQTSQGFLLLKVTFRFISNNALY